MFWKLQYVGFERFSPVALQPKAGYGLLILEASVSHSLDAPQSVGLLWMSDKLLPDNTQHLQQTSMIPAVFEPPVSAGERP